MKSIGQKSTSQNQSKESKEAKINQRKKKKPKSTKNKRTKINQRKQRSQNQSKETKELIKTKFESIDQKSTTQSTKNTMNSSKTQKELIMTFWPSLFEKKKSSKVEWSNLPNDIIIKIVKDVFQMQLKEYQQKHQKKFRGVVQQINCIFQTSKENHWDHFDFDSVTQRYEDEDDAGTRDNFDDDIVNMWIDGKTDIIKPSNLTMCNLYSCWVNTCISKVGNERYIAFMDEHFNFEEDGYVPNYDVINVDIWDDV